MKPGLGQIDNNEECAINNLNIQAKMIHLKGRQKKTTSATTTLRKMAFMQTVSQRLFFPIDRLITYLNEVPIAFGCSPKCVKQSQIALE